MKPRQPVNPPKAEAESVPSNKSISPRDLFTHMIPPNERDDDIG